MGGRSRVPALWDAGGRCNHLADALSVQPVWCSNRAAVRGEKRMSAYRTAASAGNPYRTPVEVSDYSVPRMRGWWLRLVCRLRGHYWVEIREAPQQAWATCACCRRCGYKVWQPTDVPCRRCGAGVGELCKRWC